jgi:hypothetical protein
MPILLEAAADYVAFTTQGLEALKQCCADTVANVDANDDIPAAQKALAKNAAAALFTGACDQPKDQKTGFRILAENAARTPGSDSAVH